MQLSEMGEAARAGDRDRFEAALFEDDETLRERFFTLIALNAELARTRLRVSEPHIGLIRLQWWRDAIEEATRGADPRAHELAAPVAMLVKAAPDGFAEELHKLVDAWERDLDPNAFGSLDGLRLYLESTAARMMRLGGFLALGRRPNALEETALTGAGLADGVARALAATPLLATEHRAMLPLKGPALASLLKGEPDDDALSVARALAAIGREALDRGEAAAGALPPGSQARLKPVLLSSWRARRILAGVVYEKEKFLQSVGPESPFRRRVSLLARGLFGRY